MKLNFKKFPLFQGIDKSNILITDVSKAIADGLYNTVQGQMASTTNNVTGIFDMSGSVNEYVAGIIISTVRESYISEVVARRFAMDNAGKNATEMIDTLQLQYNRARQGAITQEITEIVAGSGAQ